MGYSKNPFNSPEGQKVVKDIFDLMFIEPQNEPSEIEKTDKIRQVSHYRGNIISIVNKMKRFVTGYQQVPRNETASSGIHVCPHCAWRDAIWNWEVVDAGHYLDLKNHHPDRGASRVTGLPLPPSKIQLINYSKKHNLSYVTYFSILDLKSK